MGVVWGPYGILEIEHGLALYKYYLQPQMAWNFLYKATRYKDNSGVSKEFRQLSTYY